MMAQATNVTPANGKQDNAAAEQNKFPVDLVSGWFDRGFDKVGRAYGRQAVKNPACCSLSGLLILIVLAIPFFIKLGETDHRGSPIRSRINVKRGFEYRSDYGMWSPVSTPQAERLKRVEEDAQGNRKKYLDSAAHKASVIGYTKNPDIATELNQQCMNLEKGKEERFYVLVYSKTEPDANGNGVDLCKTDNIEKVWNFEQYLKKRATKEGKGYAYAPDFCPLNPDLFINDRQIKTNGTGWNGEGANILWQQQGHMEPCGNYKEAGHPGYHEHKACVEASAASTVKCECVDRTTCAVDATFGGASRPSVVTCTVTGDSDCYDQKNGKSAEACVRCPFYDSAAPAGKAQMGEGSTPGTCAADMRRGFNSDQMPPPFWCDKFSVVSPLGLMNAIAYNFDASVDNALHWSLMSRPSMNSANPSAPDTRTTPYGNPLNPDHFGKTRIGLMKEFGFRAQMSTYMANVALTGKHVDRRLDLVRNGTCAQCRSVLKAEFVQDVDRNNGSFVAPAPQCSNCLVGGDEACVGCSNVGGGAIPAGADPWYAFHNLDASLPGNQNIAQCEAYSTSADCYNNGCQWIRESSLASMNYNGGPGDQLQYYTPWKTDAYANGICKPCYDNNFGMFWHSAVGLAGCFDRPQVCQCGKNAGGCYMPSVFNTGGGEFCPHGCGMRAGSADAYNSRMCTNSGVDPDGRRKLGEDPEAHNTNFIEQPDGTKVRVTPEEMRTYMLAKFAEQGIYPSEPTDEPAPEAQAPKRNMKAAENPFANAEARKLASAEGTATADQCTLCEQYVTFGDAKNRTSLDNDGSLTMDTMTAPYEVNECKAYLMVIRLRPECELNHPDWRRIANNFKAPDLVAREDWVREVIDEYTDNYKHDKDSGEKVEAPKAQNLQGVPSPWRALHDSGIGVTIFHTYFLGDEMTELITEEILGLGLTFVLMYFFLVSAIGPMQWRRWVLSILVLVQPIIALLMTLGICSIPIWAWVPGDLDHDGEEDNVIPSTVLTALGLHLMLAVIVDYDIIMVRALDRITKKIPYSDRIAVAAGYAHRTISVSMLVGICAFALGSVVDLPVLTYFCWQSAVCMVGLYIGMFSFFLGSMAALEKTDPANAEEENDEGLSAESDFPRLVIKNEWDLKFARALSHPFVIGAVIVFELVFIGIAIFGEPLKAEFEGSRYLLPDSKVRLFADKVDASAGFPDVVSVWLPPSSIGKYHLPERRKYYMTVIDQMRAIPEVNAVQSGLPSLFSWLHEYEAQLRGTQGMNVSASYEADYDPTAGEQRVAHAYASDFAHKGCTACPRVIRSAYYPRAVRFDDTAGASIVDNLFKDSGNADTLSQEPSTSMFTVRGLNHNAGSGFEIYDHSGQAAVAVASHSAMEGAFQNSMASDGFQVAAVVKVAPAADQCGTVLLTVNPTNAAQRWANHTSVAGFKMWLQHEVSSLASGEKLEVRFRSLLDGRFTMDSTFGGDYAACNNRTSYITSREPFWATDEGAPYFYEFVHDFYENWNSDRPCCSTILQPHTLLDKPNGAANQANTNVFSKLETRTGRLSWSTSGKSITGIQSSIVAFYITYKISESQARIDIMHKLQDLLEKHRTMYPDRWGKLDDEGKADDSFVVARFFPNADRDEHMNDYLQHHLLFVYLATVISCMIFMHPFYGLMTAVFLMICMVQIQGLMRLMDINLDICSFAVLVMAMGFAIEYVVHIAHAFLHCNGRGLERTQNAQEEMGLTVFSAFLSTAVQQIVLLIMGKSLVFETYSSMMMLVIIKSGMTGFLLVPGLLGLLDELAVKLVPEKHQAALVTRRKSLTDAVIEDIRQTSKERASNDSKEKAVVAAAA
ncbi:unnamed protein product [Amoebophrya sp. A25]|nr:unnamed protein product [Amoebophrya sp. A25]|eukprot:GSA25T00018315001.1